MLKADRDYEEEKEEEPKVAIHGCIGHDGLLKLKTIFKTTIFLQIKCIHSKILLKCQLKDHCCWQLHFAHFYSPVWHYSYLLLQGGHLK